MTKYLFLDTEMGGRELKYSLLTAAFIVTDENFLELDRLNLNVKPDDGVYILSGQGMQVNKINIATHDNIAFPYKNAKTMLYNFLKENIGIDGGKLVPCGHGVKGDISHIIQSLISEGSWEQFCSYHYVDTSVVLQYLRSIGKMPMDVDGSLGALAKYFEIKVDDSKLHDAMIDAALTARVLEKFVCLGKNPSVV